MATPKYSYMENPKHDLTGFKIEEGKYNQIITKKIKTTDRRSL